MPRKRAATADNGTSQAKKGKASTEASPDQETTPTAPNAVVSKVPQRWSPVSASANIAKGHEERLAKPEEAFVFECQCLPRFERAAADEWEDEDEDDDEQDDDEQNDDDADAETKDPDQPKCDAGKTCLCHKKAADHPDHPWVLSVAGQQIYLSQFSMSNLRDPDNFNMYTFNDHFGYGLIEMLQNLMLDFVHAADWREQWSVAEATVMWLLDNEAAAVMQVDAGAVVQESYALVGRLFLTMVARLDREGVMGSVPNLGTIMALYMKLAQDSREENLLDGDEDEEKVAAGVIFNPGRFDAYVLAYAKKHGVTLRGPKDLDRITAECGEVKLPSSAANKGDPWKCAAAFKRYEGANSGRGGFGSKIKYSGIGGDYYDVTTWAPAERKKASFDGKDPITRSMMESIKKGFVMHLA